MKKKDVLFVIVLALIVAFVFMPMTKDLFMHFTTNHPFISGFIKFFILATMGELLAIRLSKKEWIIPKGIFFKMVIWGLIGMLLVLIFNIYASGVRFILDKGILPGRNSAFAFAFLASFLMNTTFAPTMMSFHRITDTYIEMKHQGVSDLSLANVVNNVDWSGFVSFVIKKTIFLFWIPAHTITFMLPGEYRVLVAAFLSIALGILLSIGNKSK